MDSRLSLTRKQDSPGASNLNQGLVLQLSDTFMIADRKITHALSQLRRAASGDKMGPMAVRSLISIVDDDQSFRESMKRLLRSLGYSVVEFPSATEFLSSGQLDATACLVADIQMPAMSGVELVGRLRQQGCTIPTILVTAYPDASIHERILALGVARYFPKPLEEAAFVACIRTFFKRGQIA